MNKKLSLGFHLINTFPNNFSFISVNQEGTNALQTHYNKLDNIYEDSLANQDTIFLITDASIKNNVTTSMSHVFQGHNIINRSIYHIMNINSVEIELFSIRYRINQAMKQQDALKIIVVTNAIPIAKCIFDSSIHPHQLHSIAILKSLRDFFKKNPNNLNSFWNCPESIK